MRPPSSATTLVERYRLGSVLGEGGMSVVRLALDLRTGHEVAVKLMSTDWPTDELRARFEREVQLISNLSHPNIVAVSDWGEDAQGRPYFVMQRLHGTTLGQLLHRRNSLREGEALRVILPVMGALAYAHDRHVVHRDLKPDNIFLSRAHDGTLVPKLLDFGIVVALSTTRLTRTGVVLGTAPYVSPEQAQDQPITPQTDVWSLAVVLYRCLAGRPPYQCADAASTLMQIIHDPAPTLSSLAPQVNARVAAVIDRALSRSIERRFANMRQFAQALLATARSQGIELPDDPDPVGLSQWGQWNEQALHNTEPTVQIVSPMDGQLPSSIPAGQ